MRSFGHHTYLRRLTATVRTFGPPALVGLCILFIPATLGLRLGAESPPKHASWRLLPHHTVRPLLATTATELLDLLGQAWDRSDGRVPGLAPLQFPSDLDQLAVEERKEVFFRSVLPHVLAQNTRIARERSRLLGVAERAADGGSWQAQDLQFLDDLAARYRLDTQADSPLRWLPSLLAKVDVVPPSLALAQAAIESAWGTSRFAQLGNNLFGQWVFHRDQGIAPLERPDDANYSLARFPSLGHAVEAYLENLNGFSAYREFRQLRRQMRDAELPLDSYRLAEGLTNYSTRREAYVEEIRAVIRSNDLTRFDQASLTDPTAIDRM